MKSKAKLIIVGLVSEQVVATFRCESEAHHCGSLLQSSTEDKNLLYYVETKEKGITKRRAVDSFIRRVPFLNQETRTALHSYYQ